MLRKPKELDDFLMVAHKHNEEVENFYKVTLSEHFGSETITIKQWFEAQDLIAKEHFYEKGKIILNSLRRMGYDVKIDMQTNKLLLANKVI